MSFPQSTRELVTSKKKLVTRNKLTSLQVRERALLLAEGLTSLQAPNDMTGWYCKAFKHLGEGRYASVCSIARQGNNPSRLFAWLLKEEMRGV